MIDRIAWVVDELWHDLSARLGLPATLLHHRFCSWIERRQFEGE